MNLTESNLSKNIKWLKEYSVKSSFNMTNLFPEDWNNLLNKILNDLDGQLANDIYKYYTKSSDLADKCDTDCKKNLICDFKQARSIDYIKC